MQPDGPFRFVKTVGVCQVGRIWSAVDENGRSVTVAVLEPPAAADDRWRTSFADAANALAQPSAGGPRYVQADFSVAAPWVAYAVGDGPGAEGLFQALGMECQPAPLDPAAPAEATPVLPIAEPSTADSTKVLPVLPAMGTDEQTEQLGPVDPGAAAPPQPVSTPPQPPWAAEPLPIPSEAVSGPSQLPWAAEPGPTSSGPPHSPWVPRLAPSPPQPTPEVPLSPAPGPVPTDPPSARDPFSSPAHHLVPSAPSPRRNGLLISIGVLVLLIIAAGGGIALTILNGSDSQGQQPAPPYTLDERALAIAAPSLVFVETIVTGHLRDKKTNQPLRSAPITFSRRCSGFVVSPDGHVLTSGSCVKPSEDMARQIALEALGRMLIREQQLDSAKFDDFVKSSMGTTLFTGDDPISEPATQLFGQFSLAAGNLTDEPAIPGEVIKILPVDAGNLAVIKLRQENLPVAEVNTSAALEPGASLLIVGYHTTDTDFRTATYTPSSKNVTITSDGMQGSVSILRINDDLGGNSHGGVALDGSGRVVAMLDHDQSRPDRANRALVPAPTMVALLDRAQVKNTLSDSDKLYRSGLDAYFAGRYSVAVARLDTAVKASSTNLTAQTYRQKAADRQKIVEGTSSLPGWLVPLLAGVGGALLATVMLLVMVLLRRRRQGEA